MIPSLVQMQLGNANGGGFWVDHVLQGLLEQENITVRVLCRGLKTQSGTVNEKLSFEIFEEKIPYVYYPELEELFLQEVRGFAPDVIHIWGTEYGHTLAMMNACEKMRLLERTAINIQGLCSYVAIHHNEGIPQRWIHATSFRDFLRRDNLAQQVKTFEKRGKLEVKALEKAHHVIGRTEWDRAAAMQINPKLRYHTCNETMRVPFYTDSWNYAQCCKHRIFLTNWTSPPKGFHVMLEAFHEVLKAYPDSEIYVAGKSYYPSSWKDRLRMRAHNRYLMYLTEKYGVKDKIHFLGYLTAEQMKENYLKANVFALPSSIDNSPNTVCEAMLLGVPCVSSAVGGLMKMLVHGKEGFLYQSTAYYMLAYYIKEIFAMEEAAENLGAAAKAHAVITHDPERNLQALLEIYEEIGKEA